mgnify:CR=1 FL=1
MWQNRRIPLHARMCSSSDFFNGTIFSHRSDAGQFTINRLQRRVQQFNYLQIMRLWNDKINTLYYDNWKLVKLKSSIKHSRELKHRIRLLFLKFIFDWNNFSKISFLWIVNMAVSYITKLNWKIVDFKCLFSSI